MSESKKLMLCPVHGEQQHKSERQNKAGYIRWRCCECSYARQKKSIQSKKAKLVNAFGGCCACCGYDRYVGALEFHHLDRTLKEFKVSAVSYSYERAYNEAKKCVLLCSNCHKEIEGGIRVLPEKGLL